MTRPSYHFDLVPAAGALLLAAGVIAGCGSPESMPDAPEAAAQAAAPAADAAAAAAAPAGAQIERGRYLVTITACNDCHTPFELGPDGPAPDMTRMLSGHPEELELPPPPQLGDSPWVWAGAGTNTAFSGPWGVSYAPNLTPDENTGIGIWTEEIFINTMRSGRHWGASRPILPPMPWPSYARMTDEDLKAVFAYLRSIPPIHNRVPEAVVAPPPQAQPAAGG